MDKKTIIILVLIFLVIVLFIAYIKKSPESLSFLKIGFKSIISNNLNSSESDKDITIDNKITEQASYKRLDLSEFGKNPENFIGKNVTIIGMITGRYYQHAGCGDAWLFADEDGYTINVCPITKRDFNGYDTYTLKGTIQKSVDSSGTFGTDIMLMAE